MRDLDNEEARGPQLYKVVLDVLKENRDQLEITERNIDKLIEKKIDLPFKFGTQALKPESKRERQAASLKGEYYYAFTKNKEGSFTRRYTG